MSLLQRAQTISFDATNPEHRAYFHTFRTENTWRDAPQFTLEGAFVSVPDMISHKMLNYYMYSEFGTIEV